MFFFSEIMFFDEPFGLGKAPWDKAAVTKEQRKQLLSMFGAVDRSDDSVVVFCCKVELVGEVVECLKDSSWSKSVGPVYWYKRGFNKMATNNQLLNAVECFVVGRKSDRGMRSKVAGMPTDPLHRHNFLECPQLRKYFKCENGDPVNIYEKPGAVIQWFLERFTTPSATIVIVGAGAGGDVMGAIEKGWNVNCVESDEAQVKALSARLRAYQDAHQVAEGRRVRLSQQSPRTPSTPSTVEGSPLKSCPNCDAAIPGRLTNFSLTCRCGNAICNVCCQEVEGAQPPIYLCGDECKEPIEIVETQPDAPVIPVAAVELEQPKTPQDVPDVPLTTEDE